MQDGPFADDPSQRRTDWAEARTDWAEDRTLQANERTFAGWMRTGLGAIGVALGLKAVFGSFDPTWAAKAVASIFVVAALAIIWSAEINARRAQKRLKQHAIHAQSPAYFRLLAVILSVGALATGAILWSL